MKKKDDFKKMDDFSARLIICLILIALAFALCFGAYYYNEYQSLKEENQWLKDKLSEIPADYEVNIIKNYPLNLNMSCPDSPPHILDSNNEELNWVCKDNITWVNIPDFSANLSETIYIYYWPNYTKEEYESAELSAKLLDNKEAI